MSFIATAGVVAAALTPAVAASSGAAPKEKVLVLGDSVGQGVALGLQRDARLKVVNASGVNCTLSGGTLEGYHGDVIGSGCPEWRTDWPPIVQREKPRVVLVVTGGWEIVDRWFDNPGVGLPRTILDPTFAQHVADAHKEASALLSTGGAKVAFLTTQYLDPRQAYPVPPGVNGISEIWWEPYGPDKPPPAWQAPRPGQPFVGSKAKIDALNKVKLDLARQRAITVFDLNAFVSPKGKYTKALKGKRVRDADRSHFNNAGYDLVADWLVPKLKAIAKEQRARST